MMPATAVVASTDRTSLPPLASASPIRRGVSHDSRAIAKLRTAAATMAQNTARNGDRPIDIRTATRSSEVKWR